MTEKRRTPHQYPTKSDLQKVVSEEVKLLKDEAVKELKETLSQELKPLKEDIFYLMQKDHDDEVISDWLKKHPQYKKKSEVTNQQWLNRELIKVIIYILGILAAAIGGPHLWHG